MRTHFRRLFYGLLVVGVVATLITIGSLLPTWVWFLPVSVVLLGWVVYTIGAFVDENL